MKNTPPDSTITIVSRFGIFLSTMLLISCVSHPSPAQEALVTPQLHDASDEIDCGASPLPSILPGSTVMLVGDSLAVGMDSKFKSLAKRDGYNAVSHAVNGTSILQWLNWIKRDLDLHDPDLVLVSLGTNDAVIYDRIKRYPDVYGQFVRAIESTGAKVVWIGPPNISIAKIPRIEEERRLLKSSVPLYFESEKIETPRGGDGVHSSGTGYNRWMGGIWEWMIQERIVSKQDN